MMIMSGNGLSSYFARFDLRSVLQKMEEDIYR